MTEAYDGREVVGMDLHRRRSVLVRMTAALSYSDLLRQAAGKGLPPPLEPTAPHGANGNCARARIQAPLTAAWWRRSGCCCRSGGWCIGLARERGPVGDAEQLKDPVPTGRRAAAR